MEPELGSSTIGLIIGALLAAILAGCAPASVKPFEEFMAHPSFAGVQRELDCGAIGLFEHETACVSILLVEGELPDMSVIANQVASATGTQPDHIVCSLLAMNREFNCVFFGNPENDRYSVLFVYGRSRTDAAEIMMAVTSSTQGPEELRRLMGGND